MVFRKRFLWVVFSLMALLMAAQFTGAAVLDGLAFSLSCGGFTSQGGTLVLDRNNTGLNREEIIIRAVDGTGSAIFAPAADSFLVGTRLTLPAGLAFNWTRAPLANPLTLTIISSAGNDLLEQEVYSTSFNCPSLSEISDRSLLPADGVASPSVPLNAQAPRPLNDSGSLAGQRGYLLVNTDNLFVRSGDSVGYTVVAIVDGGTQLIVLGRNPKASWWYVQAGEVRGWVNNVHVTVRGDLRGVPVVNPIGTLIPPTLFLFAENPLRAAPNNSATVLCNIPGNLEYLIVGRNQNRTWYEIEASCNGLTVRGWMPLDRGVLRNPARLSAPVTG